MIEAIRAAFNAQFTSEKYQQYLANLNKPFKDKIPFRIAETPVFIDKNFKYLIVEDISDNCYIIANISKKTHPIAVSPCAYFFYNFAYSPFKSNNILIVN
jgi:hypothetical protein